MPLVAGCDCDRSLRVAAGACCTPGPLMEGEGVAQPGWASTGWGVAPAATACPSTGVEGAGPASRAARQAEVGELLE